MLVLLAIALAGIWFFFELRRSRRRDGDPLLAPYPMMSVGGDTVILSDRLVALTEAVVQLVARHDEPRGVSAPRPFCRIPRAPGRHGRPDLARSRRSRAAGTRRSRAAADLTLASGRASG